MRRLAALLAFVCAGLVLIAATPAHAANGLIIIDGVWHPSPQRGCIYDINSPEDPGWVVENHTDQTLTLYSSPAPSQRCLREPFATIGPGETRAGTNHLSVVSVWVPA
ncbi:hypothetical protein RB625_31995 [Streptomyces californicus]|uniref:hypothetical protein n=1 Tax=Streptomyces californicus TaxID=67351 RepID=UPI00296EB122|nr:hypothetical protein [Streptomyces californicus]MDW4903039.1 hypothetical protein [Streptomyces californicus]